MEKIKYLSEIQEAFTACGFKPRDGQIEAVSLVLQSFLDDEKKITVLNAPTGTGKSILGAVIAEVLERKKGSTGLSAFMLMGQNVLAQQYYNTFVAKEAVRTGTFVFLKGSNNYECSALSGNGEEISAESCALRVFQENGMDEIVDEHCKNCEFMKIKARKNECRNLITNYSYYFIDRMYLSESEAGFSKRTLAIFDEAQTLNDLFVEHNAIYFSEKRLKQYHDEIAESLKLGNSEVFKNLKRIQGDLKAGKITEKNYMSYLKMLYDIYKQVHEQAEKEAKGAIKSFTRYTKLSRLGKKYFGLGCKIDDLLKYNYDHIFEYKKEEQEISVKAIFCGDMFKQLVNSDYMLFMSATITKEYLVETLNLDPREIKFVQLEPTFPKENKKVVFWSPLQLNYTTLKEDKTIKTIQDRALAIVKKHAEKNENGIILTPSFELTRKICDRITKESGFKVYEHARGEKLEVVLAQFKEHSGKPAVLVSPSMYEGISLDDDMSRYQLFVKAPYPSLGDKRMKYILDNHPSVYEFITLCKTIQGCGRSTRGVTDYSTTYAIDNNIVRLWNSKQNIWKNEFDTRYIMLLE